MKYPFFSKNTEGVSAELIGSDLCDPDGVGKILRGYFLQLFDV